MLKTPGKQLRGIRAAGAGIAGTALIATMIAACSSTSKIAEPFDDAPVNGHLTGPAVIVNMPDGFSNFAEKCDNHGNRIFTAFHGDANRAAIAVIRDPSCPGYLPGR